MTKSIKTKPLSAYNLFFQYKRIKLLASADELDIFEACDNGPPPGIEDVDPNSPILQATEYEIRQHRKQVIEHTIDNSPFDSSSKKTIPGSIKFLEMSNYMSKRWKNADETTKSIFRQLSNERKAKQQKQQFDLYKKSAERFSLTAKSVVTSKVETDELPRIVSLDSVGSFAHSSPKYEVIKTPSYLHMGNSTWDEPTPMRTYTNVASHPFLQGKKISNNVHMGNAISAEPSPSLKQENTTPKNHFNSQDRAFTKILQADCRRFGSSNSAPNTMTKRQDYPNYGSVPTKVIEESINKPLPFLASAEEVMSNDELQGWLSHLDWNQV